MNRPARVTSDEGRVTSKNSRGGEPPVSSSLVTRHSSLVTRLHILVAEDNELSAQVLEQLLIRQGHRVRLATDGKEALARAEKGGFDLLLLDVHMPELDGFQVIQAVRQREQNTGRHLPVIALTARSRKEDRERCLAAGMDDFLTKPIHPPDLWAAIDQLCHVPQIVPQHEPRLPCQSLRLDLLDVPVLLAASGGDSMLFEKMCLSLQARIPEHLEAVRDALRDQDTLRLREAAHKCCGLLSEFSTVAGDLAGNLEELAAGAQLDKALPFLEQLETTARELLHQVDGISIEALHRQADAGDENKRLQ
jgi:two-component system, sensor histidine kinase and response regulator